MMLLRRPMSGIRSPYARSVRRGWAFLTRMIAAIRVLARDERIPKPLRWIAGIGLLPIPGPFDEVILLLVAPIFFAFYRVPLREAWARSQPQKVGSSERQPKEASMHAVIVSVTVKDGEAATTQLRNEIVPRVKQAPGFVAGYWVRIEGGDKGRSTIVFESEDNARAAADQIQQAPVEAVTIDSVDVGEVVEHA